MAATASGWLGRAVRYDARGGRLLELMLSASSAAEASDLQDALLDSFEVSAERFELSAFGLDLTGPASLVLRKADVRPMAARVELSLGAARVAVRRLGAVESWFSGDLSAWLRQSERAADY